MNYGNAKAAAGGTLVFTGLTFGDQVVICISAVIFIGALAVVLRRFWRRSKRLQDK